MDSSDISFISSKCKVNIALGLLRCLLGCLRFNVKVDYTKCTEK
jgi:hypothetical protein